MPQEPPESLDFMPGLLPVLDREGVESKGLDSEAGRGFGDRAHGIHASTMPHDPRIVPLACPAPIAVHDHGNMPGQTSGIDLSGEHPILATGSERLQKFLHGTKLYCTPSRSVVEPLLNIQISAPRHRKLP